MWLAGYQNNDEIAECFYKKQAKSLKMCENDYGKHLSLIAGFV